ncbi:MAG: hypothetical protein HOV79_28735 [Hamadaea sp.]|nr:hypothetical protein [Hamadaea sp.]
MTLIDLGTPEEHHPEPPPPPRWLVRLRAPGDRTLAAVAAVLACCVGVLAAAAPPDPPPPPAYRIGLVNADWTTVIAGDHLVTQREAPQPAIEGIALNGSGPRWSVPIEQTPAGRRIYEIRDAHGVLLVHTGPPGPDEPTVDPLRERARLVASEYAAYDPTNGMLLWRRPGTLVGELRDGIELGLTTDPAGGRVLTGVATRTGRTLWEHVLQPADHWTTAWNTQAMHPDTALVTDPSGEVRRLDPVSGVASVVGRVPAGASVDLAHDGRIGAVTKVPNSLDRIFWLYRLGAAEPLWHRTLPAGAPSPSPCDVNVYCVWGTGITTLDAETGAERGDISARWEETQRRLEPWQTIDIYGGRLLLARTTVSAAAWLATVDRDEPEARIRLLARAPGPVDRCLSNAVWLVCLDGRTNTDAFAVRRADLDDSPAPPLLAFTS